MTAPGTTIYDFHGRLLRDTFGGPLSDRDAFLLFALFQHYQVEIRGGVLTDRPNLGVGSLIPADTQRGCAEALASLWRGAADERADYTYWYWRWSTDWGSYQAAENLSAADRERLRELMAVLERHPFVTRFVLEDSGLLGE
jgi:hypothetical protein